MKFNFLRTYFQVGDQNKLCISISVITALDPKNINQWWYDGKSLSIHSQPQTLKNYACCKRMLQRNNGIPLSSFNYSILHSILLLTGMTCHSTHQLLFISEPENCHPFPVWRSTNVQLSFGKTAKAPSMYLHCSAMWMPVLGSGSHCCPPSEGKVNATGPSLLTALQGTISDEYNYLKQLEMKSSFSLICPQHVLNQKCSDL